MKRFLIIILLITSTTLFSQKYSLLEINAKWNNKNSLKKEKIGGVRVKFGWLEDQPKEMQSKIRSVPILVLFKDGKPIYQWIAGIDFKLNVTEEDFEKVFNKLNK
jgi:hypothetical protein|tara:strand:- start:71 stop:385 length:315 start_codon:yes stop_codon:yes gene_type:complete